MIYCYFVGSFKEKRFEHLVHELHKRLERLWPVAIVQIPEKTNEIIKILEAKSKKGVLVSLDAHGEGMDSAEFIRWVTQSSKDIHFFAWGSNGPSVETAKWRMKSLSLSPMTYSHELARVLLVEQLYRAGATLKGHPYPR